MPGRAPRPCCARPVSAAPSWRDRRGTRRGTSAQGLRTRETKHGAVSAVSVEHVPTRFKCMHGRCMRRR
eukprot:scaffold22560_cov45-Phaeocystis_antarctica.AAC.1